MKKEDLIKLKKKIIAIGLLGSMIGLSGCDSIDIMSKNLFLVNESNSSINKNSCKYYPKDLVYLIFNFNTETVGEYMICNSNLDRISIYDITNDRMIYSDIKSSSDYTYYELLQQNSNVIFLKDIEKYLDKSFVKDCYNLNELHVIEQNILFQRQNISQK